jgi:hypothetical protein
MADKFSNLIFFSEKIFFSLAKRALVDLFHCNYVSSVLVLTLVNCCKLTISQLFTLVVFIIEAQIICLRFDMSHPILDCFLIPMIENTLLHLLVVMLKREAEDTIPRVLFYLIDVESSQ